MNEKRVKEFGKEEVKNFKKDYPLSSNYLFVKDKSEIVAFGIIRPIKISYLGKTYNILGLCSIISIEKGKGYGKILVNAMINIVKKKKKSALGFTLKTKIFEKMGLKSKKGLIRKFRYKNPKTGKVEIDNEGDGIYINGKDNLINKILSTKSIVYIEIPFW